MRRFAFVVAVSAIAFSASVADAQTAEPSGGTSSGSPNDPAAEARHQYDQGTQAFAAHRYTEAAQAFEAAAAYKASAVALFTAALAWDAAGQPERAADDFGRALAVPGLAPDQEKTARDKIAAAEKQFGFVDVKGPAGTHVALDAFSEVEVPARLHGRGGAHTLFVRAKGNDAKDKRDVTLTAGTATVVDVTPAAPEPPPKKDVDEKKTPPPETPKASDDGGGTSLRKSLGLVAIGFGAATIGAGVVLGIEALDARDTFNSSPTRATFDHANGLEHWTNIAFIAGGVLVAGGVVLFVWPSGSSVGPGGQVKVGATPGGAVVRGSF